MIRQQNISLKLVPIITFSIGFLSFIPVSIYYELFWLDSNYDVPLLYNMSVMLGDSILLPILNYRIFNLYFNLQKRTPPKKEFLFWVIIGLTLSTLVNWYSHSFWVNDTFSDFIGFSPGSYSIIGYWHLIFSILQMFILILYPYIWFQSIKQNTTIAIKYTTTTWNYFFCFTLLSSFDMLNKHLFVYNTSILETIKNEEFPFVTSIFVIGLLLIMKYLHKK